MDKHKNKKLDDLEEIYKDKKGRISYNERFERGRGITGIVLFFLFFISLIGLSLAAGYYVFREPSAQDFKQGNVSLEIKGNNDVSSGEEVFYIVNYRNQSDIDIINADLSLFYPEGLIIKMVEPRPDDEKHDVYYINNLKAGAEGQIKIRGILTGDIGSKKEFEANLKYNPANTSASFTKKAVFDILIQDSYLKLAIEGEDKLALGEKNEIKVKYGNKSSQKLENMRLFIYPDKNDNSTCRLKGESEAFLTATSTCLYIDIAALAGKEEKEMDISIAANGDSNDMSVMAKIGYLGNDGEFLSQVEKEKKFVVLNSAFSAQLMVNGASDKLFADFGNSLNYTLICKNTGNTILENIEPKVLIDDNDDLLNWDSLVLEKKGSSENKEISWNKESDNELAKIEQGQEVKLNFSIQLKDRNNINQDDILENAVNSWAQIKAGDKTLKSNIVMVDLNNNLNFEAKAGYFNKDGEPIGSGPLPPKAGENTSYKISWKLSAKADGAKNIKVKAILSEGVIWDENKKIDTGELYFDYNGKSIIWSVPNLPADLEKPAEAVFEITVKPGEKYAGEDIILLDNIIIEGYNANTDAKISLRENQLTADDLSEL